MEKEDRTTKCADGAQWSEGSHLTGDDASGASTTAAGGDRALSDASSGPEPGVEALSSEEKAAVAALLFRKGLLADEQGVLAAMKADEEKTR